MNDMDYLHQLGFDYSEAELEKIQVLLHYIAKEDGGTIFTTRLLKFLYILDETSVKEIGVPSTPIEYAVAVKGPLPSDIWKDIQDSTGIFTKYLNTEFIPTANGKTTVRITPVGEPNFKLLSEYERELIHKIIVKYKKVKTNQIVDELHEDGTLWKKMVVEKNITFRGPQVSIHSIDFFDLVKDDKSKEYFLNSYYNLHKA